MIHFWLNGHPCITTHNQKLLLDFLREDQYLHGTRGACREGDCGSCQILLCAQPNRDRPEFHAINSCLLRVADLAHQHVVTIEGLQNLHHPATDHPLFRLVADAGASQCGFCSPALVIALLHWLLHGSHLTAAEGEQWINGNLCRCTGYMGQRRVLHELADSVGAELRASHHRLATLIAWGWLPAWMQFPPAIAGDDSDTPPATDLPATLLGGGTDLWVEHPKADMQCRSVLAARSEPAVRVTPAALLLNARSPLQQIADELLALRKLPVFQTFAHAFASLPIRQRATLGGNLAHASPVADSIPLLLALNAQVQTDRSVLPIQHFFTGFKRTVLQEGEIIEAVIVPRTPDCIIQFDKISRRGTTDIAVVNCASFFRVEQERIREARIALGGASPMPVRLTELETALEQQPLQRDIAPLLDTLLQSHITPISDGRGSARYRRLLSRQLILAHWQQLSLQQGHQHVGT